jgi:ADP-ribose pyrophosphatase YjhB (NUDIX family)
MEQRFYFCPKCGGRLAYQMAGERQRLVCQACGYILYENPVVGVAAIVMQDDKILLGCRDVAATYGGLWCIPCGYVEYDEDVYAAAKRELYEETGLVIEVDEVFTVLSNFHNPQAHTVGIWFKTHIVAGQLQAGDDLAAVDFFSLDNLPELAFPTDKQVITMLQLQQARLTQVENT